MNTIFEKWITSNNPSGHLFIGGENMRLWAIEVAEAIKTTPGLLWHEGEKWMSDEEVDRFPRTVIGLKDIRDRAQVAIDAYISAYNYINELYHDMDKVRREQDAEITRLRGELEELKKTFNSLYGGGGTDQFQTIEALRSELDKAKEAYEKEIEALKSQIKYANE